jgi:hypothetical protein
MPPKVYHHDHTAGVRARLAHLAVTGVIGLLLAAAGAAVTTVIVRVGDGQPSPPGLVGAVWVGVASVAALCARDVAGAGRGWSRLPSPSTGRPGAGRAGPRWSEL